MKSHNQIAPDSDHITRKEMRDLLHAMDNPKFNDLLDEYAKETSNPNNVKETNLFLKQSEEQKDLPPNVKLAKPTPGFCIKSEKYSIKRPAVRQKVYINICSYSAITPPKEVENGMWNLPYLLNKGRRDQDKKGELCMTYDVALHPDSIKKASESMSFKKFIADTAINGINEGILKSDQEKISSDYVLKKKYEYKGAEVAYMNVHSLNPGDFDSRKEPADQHKTKMQKEVDDLKKKNEAVIEEEEEEEKVYDKPDLSTNDLEEIKGKGGKTVDEGSKIPKYKIKYSDKFELHKYFYEPSEMDSSSCSKYKSLLIEIETPRMDNITQAELNMDIRKLEFKYKDTYELNLDLPVSINKETITAKFDKGKAMLSVSADIMYKTVEKPQMKEDENVEIIKDDENALEETKTSEKENHNIPSEPVFITGTKPEIQPPETQPEIKWKQDNTTDISPEDQHLVEEIPSEPLNNSGLPTTTTETNTQPVRMKTDDNKMPLVLMTFNCDWIYDID